LDPDDDALSFVKLSGPQWLVINSQGIFTGTPGEEDVGINVWLVRVNTDDGTGVAYMQIDVIPAETPEDNDSTDTEEEDDAGRRPSRLR